MLVEKGSVQHKCSQERGQEGVFVTQFLSYSATHTQTLYFDYDFDFVVEKDYTFLNIFCTHPFLNVTQTQMNITWLITFPSQEGSKKPLWCCNPAEQSPLQVKFIHFESSQHTKPSRDKYSYLTQSLNISNTSYTDVIYINHKTIENDWPQNLIPSISVCVYLNTILSPTELCVCVGMLLIVLLVNV